MDKVSCANFTTHAVYFRIVFLVAVIEKMGVPFTVQSVTGHYRANQRSPSCSFLAAAIADPRRLHSLFTLIYLASDRFSRLKLGC